MYFPPITVLKRTICFLFAHLTLHINIFERDMEQWCGWTLLCKITLQRVLEKMKIAATSFKVQNADWHSAFEQTEKPPQQVKEKTCWTLCVKVEACESQWRVFLCCYRLQTEHLVCVVDILTQHSCVNSHLFQLLDKCEQSRQLCPRWYLNWVLLYLQQRDVCMWPGLWPILVPTGLPFFGWVYRGSHCGHCTFSSITSVVSKLLRLLCTFFLRHVAKLCLCSCQKWPDWATM